MTLELGCPGFHSMLLPTLKTNRTLFLILLQEMPEIRVFFKNFYLYKLKNDCT